MALVIDTISPKEGIYAVGFLVLQGFAISTSAIRTRFSLFIVNRRVTRLIDLAYTVGLLLVAFLTVLAFDRDVWLRDLDSSPSPFPMQVLFAFVFPCLAPFFDATRFLVPQSSTQEPPSLFCPPGCNCERNKFPIDQHELPDAATHRSIKNAPASVSARTLVRVPNAIEQRDSTVISFLQ